MKLVKKVTLKELGINTKKLAKELAEGENRRIARMSGKAHRWAIKNTDLGESICLFGIFEGTNTETGESLRASMCYMPSIASDLVAASLQDNNSVEFGFDIFMEENTDDIMGFRYNVVPLIEPAEDDAMARINALLPPLIEDKTKNGDDKGKKKDKKKDK